MWSTQLPVSVLFQTRRLQLFEPRERVVSSGMRNKSCTLSGGGVRCGTRPSCSEAICVGRCLLAPKDDGFMYGESYVWPQVAGIARICGDDDGRDGFGYKRK